MSYLGALRLHFAGTFQAAPSTVNNDPTHYNNATFQPEFRERGTPTSPNGWWNPGGSADWTFVRCAVTSAWLDDGSAAASGDAVLGCQVADAGQGPPAKLVDLDSEQQLVSEIWGLQVRLVNAAGATLLGGTFQPAAFMDIWDRCPSARGDELAGATYQSVLTGLQWGDLGGSPFLQQLQSAATDGLLSIKFNVDAYDATFGSPTFTQGRIVGTIGPATAAEPTSFVLGRQFMTTGLSSGNFFAPAGQVNFCVAVLDAARGKLYLDLGNALPVTSSGGPARNLGTLALSCQPVPGSNGSLGATPGTVDLGSIPAATYADPSWYATTAGVVELPPDRALTAAELAAIQQAPLDLWLVDGSGNEMPGISEPNKGVYVRADQFVYRLSPGEQAAVTLFATRFGQPYPQARVIPVLDPSGLQGPTPPVATPSSAISVPSRLTTDAQGKATLTISTSAPGNPRSYIDGQVYGVRPVLEETVATPGEQYPFNPWLFVSLLVWDELHPHNPPNWHDDLQPIFQQYRNLYPVMDQFLDLSDPASLWEHRAELQTVFGLPPTNPNAMPVTRDLSPAKRRAILAWLSAPEPVLGEPAPAAAPAPAATAARAAARGTAAVQTATPVAAGVRSAASATQAARAAQAAQAGRGGKLAAAARRLGRNPPGR